MDLAEVADELYALPADEFTKARDAAAKQARADDRDLAGAIGKLKRPTASAWLVNQLARHDAGRLEELLSLGDQLREAQDALAGDDLRRLNRERHQLVHAVAESVREYSESVTDQVAREVEATLDAALSDAAAGDAVRTGRLVHALVAGGFDGVDLAGAVAVPDAKAAPRKRTAAAPTRKPAAPAPKKAAREDAAARRRAEQERARTRSEVERLQGELDRIDASVEKARAQVAQARERIAALEQDLADARATRADAERALDKAQRSRTATAREHRNAQKTLDKLG